MTTTRRHWIEFAGGAAVGALLTPAPWRLITDSALWSENWPGIPQPARGEIRARFTTCTLCNAGCPVKARCVGDQPVLMTGARGGLCPFGVAAHQAPYHPNRLRKGPVQEASAASAAAVRKLAPGEHVAILDPRPGRTASWTLRRAASAIHNAVYVAPARSPVSVDFTQARTVLSLGAPLLDGWVAPSRIFGVRNGMHLIQAEPYESRTAVLADEWLPIRPGSSEKLARALAGELGAVEAAAATGLREAQVTWLAEQLAEGGPALVIDRNMSPVVIRLNAKLGGWGRTVKPRADAPVPASWKSAAPVTTLENLPDGSVRVLVVDASAGGTELPWNEVQRKLVADHPLVIAFSAAPMAATYVLPTAVYPELMDDVPASIDSVAPEFRVAAALIAPPGGVVNPAELLGIGGNPLRERADAIHAAGKGVLETYADGKSVAIGGLKADDFWTGLQSGRWVGEAVAAAEPPVEAPAQVFCPAPAAPTASPLMTKLYQESELRLPPGRIALHPSAGFAQNARVLVEGKASTVTLNAAVPADVAVVGGWPEFTIAISQVVPA